VSWPRIKLRELITLTGGHAFKSGDFEASGIPLIRIGTANSGTFKTSEFVFLPQEYKFKYSKYLVNPGDLLITLTGTVGKGDYGNVCEATDGYDSYLLNQRVAKININSIDLSKRYLYLFLATPEVKKNLTSLSRGVRQANIKNEDILDLEIPLPPLDEQKRIAAILDKADAIRRKRLQAIQLADDFLRSVFLDMFGDPVTNPKGFKKAAITELSDVITGYAFKSAEYVQDGENSVRLCRGANTLTGYFEWKDTAYWDRDKLKGIENYIINSGDVILAMDRPWISSGLKVCVFPENQRTTYLVQRVARIRPKQAIYTDYLYSCILSSAFEKHCCPTETTVPHISPVELKNFEVLVPDEKLVQKYHDVVFKVRSSMLAMEKSLLEANSAFNSLSQKAFAGEL